MSESKVVLVKINSRVAPELLRELFFYDPDSGILRWKKTRRSELIGMNAGTPDGKGRLRVEINSKTYPVHHIIFAMHFARWPKDQLDHRNQIKTDNRIANLREATNAQNSRNRKSKIRELPKGVCLHKGRYIARIMRDGITVNLGSFDTAKHAAGAYKAASHSIHEEFACPSN